MQRKEYSILRSCCFFFCSTILLLHYICVCIYVCREKYIFSNMQSIVKQSFRFWCLSYLDTSLSLRKVVEFK